MDDPNRDLHNNEIHTDALGRQYTYDTYNGRQYRDEAPGYGGTTSSGSGSSGWTSGDSYEPATSSSGGGGEGGGGGGSGGPAGGCCGCLIIISLLGGIQSMFVGPAPPQPIDHPPQVADARPQLEPVVPEQHRPRRVPNFGHQQPTEESPTEDEIAKPPVSPPVEQPAQETPEANWGPVEIYSGKFQLVERDPKSGNSQPSRNRLDIVLKLRRDGDRAEGTLQFLGTEVTVSLSGRYSEDRCHLVAEELLDGSGQGLVLPFVLYGKPDFTGRTIRGSWNPGTAPHSSDELPTFWFRPVESE